MNTERKILSVQGLRKSFGKTEVLKGIDFEMYEGEKIVILGPSGSGKSTILRCINRLETMDDGIIIFNDHDASIMKAHELRKDIGMVFQRFNIFSHMNVLENIMEAPVHVRHMNRNEAAKEARELLKKVGLSDKEDSMPSQLSGGQLQRVGIARALAMHPQILLFDEPTSALDPELVGEVLNVMKDIAKDGTSMIVVTHEMGFAREVADRILFMDGGVILANATPEEFFTKQENPRIQSFLSKVTHK
ncbi:MAG: amino acid ABC transporter ATP-binding protein [Bullifex sp.]